MKTLHLVAAAGVAVVAFVKRDDIAALFRPTPPIRDLRNIRMRPRQAAAPVVHDSPPPKKHRSAEAQMADNVADTIQDVQDIGKRFGMSGPEEPEAWSHWPAS